MFVQVTQDRKDRKFKIVFYTQKAHKAIRAIKVKRQILRAGQLS